MNQNLESITIAYEPINPEPAIRNSRVWGYTAALVTGLAVGLNVDATEGNDYGTYSTELALANMWLLAGSTCANMSPKVNFPTREVVGGSSIHSALFAAGSAGGSVLRYFF